MSSKPKSRKATPAVGGFISFADVTSTSSTDDVSSPAGNFTQSIYLSPVYMGSDADLAVSCKKVFKKDPVTRLKALTEIKLILETRGTEVFADFISHFVYFYVRILLENQRQIIEQLDLILQNLVSINRPAFKAIMKDLIGSWWISTCDIYSKAAEIAQNSFEKAFPLEKREQALLNFSSDILLTIKTNLGLNKDNIDATIENSDDYLERIHAMSVLALVRLIESASKDSGKLTILGENDGYSYLELFTPISFWTLLLQNPSATLRRHGYHLLTIVCRMIPSAIPAATSVLLFKIVSKSLLEKSSQNNEAKFDMFIAFVSAFPAFWENYSIDKHLLSSLKTDCISSPKVSFAYLLPILSSVPDTKVSIVGDSVPRVLDFLDSLLSAINEGKVSKEHIAAGSVTVIETCCFVLLRRTSLAVSNVTVSSTFASACQLLLRSFSLLFIPWSAGPENFNDAINQLSKILAKFHQHATRSEGYISKEQWTDCFWSPLGDLILQQSASVVSIDTFHLMEAFLLLLSRCCSVLPCIATEEPDSVFVLVRQVLKKARAILGDPRPEHYLGSLLAVYIISYLGREIPDICAHLELPIAALIESIISSPWLSVTASEDLDRAQATFAGHYLRRSLDNLHTFEVVTTIDQASSWRCRLITSLAATKALPVLVFLLQSRFMQRLELEANVESVFDDFASEILVNPSQSFGGSAAGDVKIRYLVQYCTHSCFSHRSQLITRLFTTWRETNSSTALWTLLSVYGFHLSNDTYQLVEELISEQLVIDLLKSAFFGRTRDSARSHTAVVTSAAIEDDVRKIDILHSWNDIKTYLLPAVNMETRVSIRDIICDDLLAKLASSEKSEENIAVTVVGKEGVVTAVESSSPRMIEPKKFARHVCGLLSLVEANLLGEGTKKSDILRLVGLTSPLIWSTPHVKNYEYILDCLFYIQEHWEGDSGFICASFLEDAHTYIKVVQRLSYLTHTINVESSNNSSSSHKRKGKSAINQQQQEETPLLSVDHDFHSMCGTVIESIHHEMFELGDIQLVEFIVQVLDEILCDQELLADREMESLVEYMVTLYVRMKKVKPTKYAVIETPLPSDVIPRGSKVWYLRTVLSSLASGVLTDGVTALEAELAAVDRQAGELPLYTITYQQVQGSGAEVEVQTESHRLLLRQPGLTFDSILKPDVVITSVNQTCDDSLASALTKWTVQHLQSMSIAQQTASDIHLIKMIGVLIRVLGLKAESDEVYFELFTKLTAPAVRSVVLSLLSADYVASTTSCQHGLLLLKELVASRAGVGGGLWIPHAFEAIRKIHDSVKGASRLVLSNAEREHSLACLCTGISAILSTVSSKYGVELAQSLLSSALGLLETNQSITAELRFAIIECSLRIWESRGVGSMQKSAAAAAEARAQRVQSNEVVCLNIVIDVLANSEGVYSAGLRSVACTALFHCYSHRNRAEAKELLHASSAKQLESALLMIVSDSSADSTIRLFAAKTLDILYLSSETKQLVSEQTASEDTVQEELKDTVDAGVTDPVDEEAAEAESDKAVFTAVVGGWLSERLMSRLTKHPRANEYIGGGAASDLEGAILEWLLCLQLIDGAGTSSFRLRCQCGSFLKRSGILGLILKSLVRSFPDQSKVGDVAHLFQKLENLDRKNPAKVPNFSLLVVYAMFRTVCTLPAVVRAWFTDQCSREEKSLLKTLIENSFSTAIAAREVALIGKAAAEAKWTSDEMTVRGSAVSGEVVATYLKDGASIELKIKLPSAYPLLNVEVECSSSGVVDAKRWKRWVLQIVQLLSMQDGSVVDAVLILKRNIDKEFEGVEPCPICYCIFHPKSMALPTLTCPTCANKFHTQCLYTWFKSSGKSKCVLCQQPFFL